MGGVEVSLASGKKASSAGSSSLFIVPIMVVVVVVLRSVSAPKCRSLHNSSRGVNSTGHVFIASCVHAHTLRVVSQLAEQRAFPSGDTAIELTPASCPERMDSLLPQQHVPHIHISIPHIQQTAAFPIDCSRPW